MKNFPAFPLSLALTRLYPGFTKSRSQVDRQRHSFKALLKSNLASMQVWLPMSGRNTPKNTCASKKTYFF